MQKFFGRCLLWVILLLCLMLSGCGSEKTEPTEAPTAAPTQAPTEPPATEPPHSPGMDSLLTIYADADLSSPVDYLLVNFLQIDGVNYLVNWSADVGEDLVCIVDNQDGTVTVDINELCQEDTPYTLTAKIATADGRWVTHSWQCVLPKAMEASKILADARALEHGKRLSYPATLVGKITSINKNYDLDYESVTLTFQIMDADNQSVRCYGLQGEEIDSLEKGDVIAVTGYLMNYGSVLEFDSGCTLETILEE